MVVPGAALDHWRQSWHRSTHRTWGHPPTRPFQAHGKMEVVTLGDFTLGKGTFEPGWRWSQDVKPIAGTDSCQSTTPGSASLGG